MKKNSQTVDVLNIETSTVDNKDKRKTVKNAMTGLLEQFTKGQITAEEFANLSKKAVLGEEKVQRKPGEVYEETVEGVATGRYLQATLNKEGKLGRPRILGSLASIEMEIASLQKDLDAIKSVVR